jgi:single-strand DNA-binding protein
MNFNGQGTLTRDPETKHLPTGTAICEFGIACNRKNAKGEKVADFFECKAWSHSAERAAMLRKGQSVILGGDLQTESWTDKTTGAKRSKTVLVCWDIGVCPDTRLGRAEQPARASDFPAAAGARTTPPVAAYEEGEPGLPF